MSRFIIQLDREKCIGAAACQAAAPKLWKLGEDGKTNIIGGAQNRDNTSQTREITEKDLKAHLEAAQACPVNAIHIKKETGEMLI